MYCSKCGKEIERDSLYCGNCGCKLEKNDEKPYAALNYSIPARKPGYIKPEVSWRVRLFAVLINIVLITATNMPWATQKIFGEIDYIDKGDFLEWSGRLKRFSESAEIIYGILKISDILQVVTALLAIISIIMIIALLRHTYTIMTVNGILSIANICLYLLVILDMHDNFGINASPWMVVAFVLAIIELLLARVFRYSIAHSYES